MNILSIIIVSFNTKELTIACLDSLEKNYANELSSGKYEIIISDNGSTDGSVEAIKKFKQKTTIAKLFLIENKRNLGFSKANNVGIKKATGSFILFLNSDTVVYKHTLTTLLSFLESHKDVGLVTCKLLLPNGKIDDASHRGFPTPWNSFCHFSGISKIFPKSTFFNGYNLGWKNINSVHAIDACAGAFMIVRRHAGEDIGWWDEDYFFYGEDLDFCYSLKEKGWKIYYIPTVSILHYKGVSSGIKKHSQYLSSADMERKKFIQHHRFEAMKIFYRKHYMNRYPPFVTWMVFSSISFLKRHYISKV